MTKAQEMRKFLMAEGVSEFQASRVVDFDERKLHSLSNSLAKYQLMKRRYEGYGAKCSVGKLMGAEVEHYCKRGA
jgi:hypothetical protein